MLGASFLRNTAFAVALFLAVAALGAVDRPTTTWLRSYVSYAVSNDIDLSRLAVSARNLGAFTQKVDWRDLLRSLTARPAGAQPGGQNRQ